MEGLRVTTRSDEADQRNDKGGRRPVRHSGQMHRASQSVADMTSSVAEVAKIANQSANGNWAMREKQVPHSNSKVDEKRLMGS